MLGGWVQVIYNLSKELAVELLPVKENRLSVAFVKACSGVQ
jgi:hypothetical protein